MQIATRIHRFFLKIDFYAPLPRAECDFGVQKGWSHAFFIVFFTIFAFLKPKKFKVKPFGVLHFESPKSLRSNFLGFCIFNPKRVEGYYKMGLGGGFHPHFVLNRLLVAAFWLFPMP